ncbi:hypothetical protein Mucpa_0155 [Mucilaginibacter paludis DSM 18603]|uniref:Uncharacterized protein n=1 Tax=Mucilaginibacter paludis DSM 18603 TaxID=714943 RepID=H1YET8_9SPHI|nr:hypothetical protein Mucpa_0155 [Mucilaginibacter paludis DSM 18603]
MINGDIICRTQKLFISAQRLSNTLSPNVMDSQFGVLNWQQSGFNAKQINNRIRCERMMAPGNNLQR